jgi:hypothetical protein
MSRTTKQLWQASARVACCASLLLLVCRVAAAQSADPGSPTPVYTGEIAGRIAPLDIGDARPTRHFYTFNVRSGDLELTVEANNLEGDIDLFAAATMRPLAKVTLYAGLGSNITRTIFFRRDDTVILRVQARSPNDTDGTYNIRLGGTFAPSTAPVPDESARNSENTPAASKPTDRGVRRVNSVGARIEEPKIEVATEPAAPEHTDENATPKPATTARTTNARGRAARRPPARRGAAQRGTNDTTAQASEGEKNEPGKVEASESSPAKNEPANTEAASSEPTRSEAARTRANTNRTRSGRGRNSRAGDAGSRPAATTGDATSSTETTTPPANESPAAPAATGLEAPGSRIVLELRDGTRVVREMSEVRRVAIEGRLVVITLKNGRVERQPLANVERMSIEP